VLEWYRVKTAPRVLGHEMAGDVAEVGEGVADYEVGDRVFVTHHVPCNKCRYCLSDHHTACATLHSTNYDPGGFAEYVRIPKINVGCGTFKLPEGVSYEEGTFLEPLGCVIRGQRVAGVEKEQTLLVLGSGISGLLHIKCAKANGVNRILATDINEYRLKKAKNYGADEALNARENIPEKVRQHNDGYLADQVVVCTGAPQAVEQAFQCVERGGKILFFAVPEPEVETSLPLAEFWKNEVTLTTSYAAAPKDLAEALRLIQSKKVDVSDMVTHRLGLAEAAEGFRLVAQAKESVKVILEPQR